MIDKPQHLIEKHKIIIIIRNIETKQLIDIAKALYKGGIRLIELTFDQKDTENLKKTSEGIETLCNYFNDEICIGAGTVMNRSQVEVAAKAGAKYIISPHTDIDVIKRTLELNMVSIPGATTPTEIVMAYNLGADLVKLFPAGNLGINYVKSICAPINHIPILAVGGINSENMKDFLKAGVKGFGIGSNIIKPSYINEKKYEKLTEIAKEYVRQI